MKSGFILLADRLPVSQEELWSLVHGVCLLVIAFLDGLSDQELSLVYRKGKGMIPLHLGVNTRPQSVFISNTHFSLLFMSEYEY
jgi:hypothetical protein